MILFGPLGEDVDAVEVHLNPEVMAFATLALTDYVGGDLNIEDDIDPFAARGTLDRDDLRCLHSRKSTPVVELKLSEQRNFVLWWDGQPKGRPPKVSQNGNAFRLKDVSLDASTLHRWRVRLGNQEKTRAAGNRLKTGE